MFSIKYTSEELASALVPETIKYNNVEFYDLIKAFTANIVNTKEYYENGYNRLVNINRITSQDIIKIYLDTYAKTLNIDNDQENVILLRDIIGISKDLSTSKGTVYLFNLLASILKYLLKDINTTYDEIIDNLDSNDLSIEEKEKVLDYIQEQVSTKENLILIEETSAYHYDIATILTQDFIEKHIIPFCHPTGWVYNFVQIIPYIYLETTNTTDNLTIYSTIKIPVPVIGDDFSLDLFTPNCPNIFDYYYGDIELGEEYQYEEILSKIYNINRVYIHNGKVYYTIERPILLSDINNLTIDDITVKDKQAFYNDATTDNSIMYRTSGTFAKGYDGMFFNNGLVISGDRIVFKYNWEL